MHILSEYFFSISFLDYLQKLKLKFLMHKAYFNE